MANTKRLENRLHDLREQQLHVAEPERLRIYGPLPDLHTSFLEEGLIPDKIHVTLALNNLVLNPYGVGIGQDEIVLIYAQGQKFKPKSDLNHLAHFMDTHGTKKGLKYRAEII